MTGDSEACAFTGCGLPASARHQFCSAHLKQLHEHARRVIESAADVAAELYIGRSSFPERRLFEHFVESGRTHLLVFHWAASWTEASQLEEFLIGEFTHLKRLKNRSSLSDGQFSSPWNALYVSFTPKSAVRALPGSVDVTSLHWRQRAWPDPSLPTRPLLLGTALSEQAAESALARWTGARGRNGRAQLRRVP